MAEPIAVRAAPGRRVRLPDGSGVITPEDAEPMMVDPADLFFARRIADADLVAAEPASAEPAKKERAAR